jgi:pimeloyl-ACP methyl ester carboxylesterase
VKLFNWACLSLPLAYMVLSPRVGKKLYRSLLFHPAPYLEELDEDPPIAGGIKAQEYFFHTAAQIAPSEMLHAWYFKNITPSQVTGSGLGGKTILLSHGNSGNLVIRLSLVELLLACGASVFVYDYRGFGKSTGLPSVEGICQDALSAYDFLTCQLGLAESNIVLYGESLGAALSSWLSCRRRVSGLILQSGFTSLRRIAAEHFPLLNIYPEWMFSGPLLDSIRVMKGKHPPLLVIHGKLDQVVPFHHGQSVYSAGTQTKAMLAIGHAAHGDLVSLAPDKMKEGISKFLQSLSDVASYGKFPA